jgi:AcrR family transcriptional regulator
MVPNTFTQRGVPGYVGASATFASFAVDAGWAGFATSASLRDTLSLSSHHVSLTALTYTGFVPRLWSKTIEAHRREVREALLDTTAALVAKHGLRSVTMSQIAEETGIGRATLYKYFPDVEAMLVAWHGRQVSGHLARLAELRDQAGAPGDRLKSVLEAYALIAHELEGHAKTKLGEHSAELGALLHRGRHVVRAQEHLKEFIRDLLTECAEVGELRNDVAPEELASYCLHALTAASALPSKAAVRRLVAVTLTGLLPPR